MNMTRSGRSKDVQDEIRAGFSGPLFHIARRASEDATGAEHSSLLAILCSALAVEAWVNELIDHVQYESAYWSPPEVQTLAQFAPELEYKGVSLELKIQLVAIALSGHSIDRGTNPYQDFALLVRIRNAIVHARPERIQMERDRATEPHDLLDQLEKRGVIALERDGTVNLLFGTLLQPPVGKWAYSTSVALAEAVAEMLPPSGLRTSCEIAFGRLPANLRRRTSRR